MSNETSSDFMKIVEAGRKIMAFIEATEAEVETNPGARVNFYAAKRETRTIVETALREGQLLYAKENGYK